MKKNLLVGLLVGLLTVVPVSASELKSAEITFNSNPITVYKDYSTPLSSNAYIEITITEYNNTDKPIEVGNRVKIFADGIALKEFYRQDAISGIDVTKQFIDMENLLLLPDKSIKITYYCLLDNQTYTKVSSLVAYDMQENKVIKELKQ